MGIEAFLDRLRAAGMNVEIIDDDNNSKIVVDDTSYEVLMQPCFMYTLHS